MIRSTSHRLALIFVLGLSPARLGAQEAAVRSALRPGRLTERIVSPSDSLRSYALYIPSAYDTTRTWPVLMLMDPRGRAMIPMERVRSAAERYGWVVLSSYDTRSDDASAPNVEAANAMLDDAQLYLHPDTRRFYFGGFSGTARLAWDFAASLGGAVAGIIASGAGVQRGPQWLLTPGLPKLAFYGTAGYTDFNYDEVRELEHWLEQGRFAWRTRYFAGGHQWMPDTLFAEAVPWLELQAMRDGRTPRRSDFVDSLYIVYTDRARSEVAPVAAHDRYGEIVRDFDGLRDTREAAAKMEALSRDRAVRRALEQREEGGRQAADYNATLARFLQDLRTSERPPSLDNALGRLRVERLLRDAAKADEPDLALAAQRMLEQTFVSASFYTPTEALAGGFPAHALLMLDVADRIHPDRPNVQLLRGRALVRLNRRVEAVEALERAVRAGVDPRTIESDTTFAPLRGDARFDALIRRRAPEPATIGGSVVARAGS